MSIGGEEDEPGHEAQIDLVDPDRSNPEFFISKQFFNKNKPLGEEKILLELGAPVISDADRFGDTEVGPVNAGDHRCTGIRRRRPTQNDEFDKTAHCDSIALAFVRKELRHEWKRLNETHDFFQMGEEKAAY